jgi:hypothetical protein
MSFFKNREQEPPASGRRCSSLTVAFPFSLINPTLYTRKKTNKQKENREQEGKTGGWHQWEGRI